MAFVIILYLGLIVFLIASLWKVFEKAGHPGWAAIVPFYNIYILTQIAGKPTWWMILFFIPIANIVAAIIVWHGVSLNFGKDAGFTVGLVLLGIVFIPILGFGDAKYIGNKPFNSDDDLLDQDLLES